MRMTEIQVGQKKGTGFPTWMIGVILLVAVVLIAGAALFMTSGQPAGPATQTAAGGNPPAAPANPFAPDVKKMNFSQLQEAGYLDTPEDIRQFMINYPFKYGGPSQDEWVFPDELLQAGGKSDYAAFSNFFGEALKSQGCWDKWDAREVYFNFMKYALADSGGSIRFVVSFRDVRNGSYAYFVPNPYDEKSKTPFPIFYTGKENDPARFEAIRLGEEIDPTVSGSRNFC